MNASPGAFHHCLSSKTTPGSHLDHTCAQHHTITLVCPSRRTSWASQSDTSGRETHIPQNIIHASDACMIHTTRAPQCSPLKGKASISFPLIHQHVHGAMTKRKRKGRNMKNCIFCQRSGNETCTNCNNTGEGDDERYHVFLCVLIQEEQ